MKTATPSKVVGVCRLCEKAANLCDSHLIPASIFRVLRSTTITPCDPVKISRELTTRTSRQISDYLLCVECEASLRDGGENWVVRNCYRGGNIFPLREYVLKSQVVDDGEMAKIYSTKPNPDIDKDALTFFGASVFWRASVHDWGLPGLPLELGPYREPLRQYLLGQKPFPAYAAMWVWVSEYDEPSRAITSPHSAKFENCHIHTFDIPGVRFDLLLGRALSQTSRLLCIQNGPDQPILLSHAPDDMLATDLDKLSKTTRLSRALQEQGRWDWFLWSKTQ